MVKTLKTKFVLWCTVSLTLVLVLGAVSIWNIVAFMRATRATAAEYGAMDQAEAVAVQVAWLRDVLRGPDARTYVVSRYFGPIEKEIGEIIEKLELAAETDQGDGDAERDFVRVLRERLDAAGREASGEAGQVPVNKLRDAAGELDALHQSLIATVKLMPASARRHVAVASGELRNRLTWTCALLFLVLLISALIHVKQFRLLVRPLLWLRDDMRRGATHQYREEVRPRGAGEFREVAGYFNGLAKELADLYVGLENKVIERSRELVRSERLASVGFLAAGVAHEINNPLSIISGYAELAAKSLRRVMLGEQVPSEEGVEAEEAEAEALSNALNAQGIIRDEAFRCKEITSRLLSLARGGTDGRQSVYLDEVARQVTVLTKGLKNYRDRRVVLDFEPSDVLEINANLTEMKQVLLNLTVNALEAVPAHQGEVRIGGQRTGEWVELSVQDNGKGMTAETLEHVFEPFFTAKRGAGEPGTGLGLSITHAIVENHGGRIRVESGGPGCGSRFTVRLPATGRQLAVAVPANCG